MFKAAWVLPYLAVQLGGAVLAALFLQGMYSHVSAGGNYPIAKPGGEWRSLVMEAVLTAILVTVILHTATGAGPRRRPSRVIIGYPHLQSRP